MTLKLTKQQATRLNLTGPKVSASVKVGPNRIAQAHIRYNHTNNLANLAYQPKGKTNERRT
jgi:hypothetical protein